MDEKVLITKEIRWRLIQLEYANLPKEEYIKEIKRIYIEEVGEPLPANIKLFSSDESKALKNDNSGYDGTAIHFISKDKNINEVYIVSQGSQGIDDWEYNLKSMLAGMDFSQARATEDFTVDALREFGINIDPENKEYSIPVIGLSHSLAHNNNTTAYLAFDTFTKVYSVNGAQTNYYQLFLADVSFREKLFELYPILRQDRNKIYILSPKELEAIAKEFYSDKEKNIYQDISYDDPLYGVSGVRGFFELGEVEMHDTNPRYPGLRKLVEQIPDVVVQRFQNFAIDYTVASVKGDRDNNYIIKELTGIDLELAESINAKTYFSKSGDISMMIAEMNKKIPDLLDTIRIMTSYSDVIFDKLMKAGYISKEQKEELIATFKGIEKDLTKVEKSLKGMHDVREVPLEQSYFWSVLGTDLGTYFLINYSLIDSLKEHLEVLLKGEYQHILKVIAKGHDISELLESYKTDNKTYKGLDLMLSTSKGGEDIWVNLSAALRMYEQGKFILEEKRRKIDTFTQILDYEIYDCYEEWKRKTLRKISSMEQYPKAYKSRFEKYGINSRMNREITRLNIHTEINIMRNADMSYEIHCLYESVEKGFTQITKYRQAIEDLFDEEMNISERFDLVGEL